MTYTVLIDGDVVAYRAAASVEKPTNWGDGLWTLHSHEDVLFQAIDRTVARIVALTGADETVVVLSHSRENWRYDVMPDYKSNRKDTRSPLLRRVATEYLLSEYKSWAKPGLEGDDVLGILSTHPKIIPGEKIIWSEDKDLYTIPGTYTRGETDSSGELIVHEVSEEAADRFHMIQALAGDPTDGYPGCPGIGMKRAAKIVDDPHTLVETTRTVKGVEQKVWKRGEPCSVWEAIVCQYRQSGLGEGEALLNARVARILRASDYDFKRKEPILWTPS